MKICLRIAILFALSLSNYMTLIYGNPIYFWFQLFINASIALSLSNRSTSRIIIMFILSLFSISLLPSSFLFLIFNIKHPPILLPIISDGFNSLVLRLSGNLSLNLSFIAVVFFIIAVFYILETKEHGPKPE